MTKKDRPDDDIDLFRKEVNDVLRLRNNKVKPYREKPRPIPRQPEPAEQQILSGTMSDEYSHSEVEADEALFFTRTGLQSKVIRKLKRGQFRLEGELDLHGLNVEAARQAIGSFLQLCQEQDWRYVRIIHGKGLSSKDKGPILKQMVNRWLPQCNEVLAFVSALPQHGGAGAIYVLLRNPGK